MKRRWLGLVLLVCLLGLGVAVALGEKSRFFAMDLPASSSGLYEPHMAYQRLFHMQSNSKRTYLTLFSRSDSFSVYKEPPLASFQNHPR